MEIAAFYFHCLKVKVVICFYSFYVTAVTRSFNDETERITKVLEQRKSAQLLSVPIMSLYQLKVKSFGLSSNEEAPKTILVF